MPHYTTWGLRDYSKEVTSFAINHGAITALSIGGFLTAVGDMRAAVDAITLGVMAKESITMDSSVLSQAAPTNVFAQRELAWRVSYSGNSSNKLFQVTIGTADPTGRLVDDTDLADLTEANMAEFVSSFNAFARSPDSDTENVTIQEIRLVGRNS